MTLEQFYQKIRALGLKWELRNGGRIRSPDSTLDVTCPLCVLANTPFAGTAAKTLSFTIQDGAKIVHAADNTSNHDPEVRRALLDACGLHETPVS
jgi:hypothetical protein